MQAAGPAPQMAATRRLRAEISATTAEAFALFGTLNGTVHGDDAANDARPGRLPSIPERRLRLDPSLPQALVRGLDWVVALTAAEAAAIWAADKSLLELPIGHAWAFLATALALKVGLWLTESYRAPRARMRFDGSFGGLALGAILGLVIAAAAAPSAAAASALSIAAPTAALVMAGVHAAFAVWGSHLHRRGVFAETIAIVGATEAAEHLLAHAARTGSVRVAAVFDDHQTSPSGAPVAGGIDELLAWKSLPYIDRIVIALPDTGAASVRAMLRRLRCVPNRIDVLMDDLDGRLRGPGLMRMPGGYAARTVGPTPDRGQALLKRVKDVALGLGLIVVSAPLMALIALAIWLENKGPVLTRAPRLGRNNRVFWEVSFGTLDRGGHAPTFVGSVLKRARLTSLPRLFNVVAGDMSLVGPRAHPVDLTVGGLSPREIVLEYAHRHRVRPGLTGWAQVNCAREDGLSRAGLRQQTLLDLDYAARPSLWLDIVILLRTAAPILGARRHD